ncbi:MULTISPECIES: helix-turn-helix domain-containing protein [Tsukamurella]|uniref:helix-turn-helix domain-containing protein n=1 Tax=Tsukamurella TaxID=2060 RepID=UPI002DD41EBF|nr:helix-turn-helix transcriptional regulator [Tsukamurella tyrosinosolvens]MEC4616445.1 helix-turn-helix transcriptional regulator [Tsukamurella tyrosinosolvens]
MQYRIGYQWRLREVMAARGMHNLSDLMTPLHDVGIELSASQLYRLLGTTPDRLPLALLGALCHVLDCTTEDLCDFRVDATPSRRRTASGAATAIAAVPDPAVRPKRARIHRPGPPQ